MKILIVLTSHAELGNTGEKTGFWIEEFAAPYYVLSDAGAELTIASPKGGQPPVDPKSEIADAQTPDTERFYKDNELIDKVAHTLKLSDINFVDYDAVFYPGGHGPLWDLATDKYSIKLIEDFYNHQKQIAFVCHAPAALLNVKTTTGKPLVEGKNVTAFSNTEETAVGLADIVPFLLESELEKQGAHYSKGADWGVHTVQDGLLITGQNPASSQETAKILLSALKMSDALKNSELELDK